VAEFLPESSLFGADVVSERSLLEAFLNLKLRFGEPSMDFPNLKVRFGKPRVFPTPICGLEDRASPNLKWRPVNEDRGAGGRLEVLRERQCQQMCPW
jgi:hypothetical protein